MSLNKALHVQNHFSICFFATPLGI